MKVLNIGSLNLDYVYQVEHFVQPGETLSAVSQQVNCGGKGLNQSVALAKAGAEGSICYTVDECVKQEACRVNVVDTTAAGDTFTGYFIAGIMEGLPVQQCMKRAAVASSLSVTRKGAAASIPEKAEVDNWQ